MYLALHLQQDLIQLIRDHSAPSFVCPITLNKKPPHLICMFCYDPYQSRQVIHGYLTIFNLEKFTVYVEFSVDTVMMGQLFCE
jgi:hypothetical protein